MARNEAKRKPFYFQPWFFAIVAVIIVGFFVWSIYNTLVVASTNVDNKWAQVDSQYQRRFDLIPRLVNTTAAYAQFEKSTLTQITQLRTQWEAASNVNDKISAASASDSAISKLLLTFENYPNLKTVQPLQALQDELSGTENRIAVARMDYNNAVRDYNIAIKLFPANLFAASFGYTEKTYFQSVSGAENAPAVPSTLGVTG